MVSRAKLIKQGIYLTDSLFDEIIRRLAKGIRASDTLEDFLNKTTDYTMNNPLVVTGYKDDLLEIILKETNNHKFSRPAQKELTRLTIENRVGDLIVDVGDDIRYSVRDIVKEGYNNKLSQDEIADNISHKIKVIKNTRARTIARTEIARTATASDYVINRERGATHFTVDCRNTCCDICRKDYNFGIIEYSIEQVDMLPPRHPNCRCYAMFFKKEGMGQKISNTFRDDKKYTNLQGSIDDNNWTIGGIKKSITRFVDKDDDVTQLATNIYNFIQVAKDHPNESLIASDNNFKELGIIKGKELTSIEVPDEFIEAVEGSYFGLTGHSHPNSKIPLPDLDDLNYGCITLNSKYNLVFAPEFGITLIKKSKLKVKPHEDDIKDAHEKAYQKRNDYVNRTADKLKDDYKKDMKNKSVSYMKQKQDFDDIEDRARFINFDEQCEIYNNELKQYGIELIYIEP